MFRARTSLCAWMALILLLPGCRAAAGELSAPDSAAVELLKSILETRDWARGDSLALALKQRAETQEPLDSLLLATALDALVFSRLGSSRTEEPGLLDLAERAVSLREHCLGPMDLQLATSLIRLAQVNNALGHCLDGRRAAERGVAIREGRLGPGDLEVARGLTILGSSLMACGDAPAAASIFGRCVSIREATLPPDHPDLATAYVNLSSALKGVGAVDAGLDAARRALEIRESRFGADSPRVAGALVNLSDFHTIRGEYTEAIRLAARALSIRENALGSDHPETATSRVSLAVTLYNMGDSERARAMYEQALASYERSQGPEHPNVAMAAEGIGAMLLAVGDAEGAIPWFDRALEIRRKAEGEASPGLYTALGNKASAFVALGRTSDALPLAERCVALAEAGRGAESPELAAALEVLANLKEDQRDLTTSISIWERALAIHERARGMENHDVARATASLARVHAELGHTREARQLFARAFAIWDGALGPGHPAEAEALADYASFLFEVDGPEAALAPATAAARLGREALTARIHTLSERQALVLAAKELPTRDLLLAIAAANPSPRAARAVWEALIPSRGPVLEEMATRLRMSQLLTGPEAGALKAELTDASAWLAHVLTGAGSAGGPEEATRRLDAARSRLERAEQAVAQAGLKLRDTGSPAPLLADISAARPQGSALVTYARYRDKWQGDGQGGHYLALVLPAGSEDPLVIPLGDEDQVETLIERWRAAIAKEADLAQVDALGREVRSRLWDPVAGHLRAPDRVFVTPDGPLHLVPFYALPLDNDRYLAEDGPIFHTLTAERDLLEAEHGDPGGRGLLVLGDAVFDSVGLPMESDMADAASGQNASNARFGTRGSYRGAHSSCVLFKDVLFGELRGSEAEIGALAQTWRSGPLGRAGEPLFRASGRWASEETFKRWSPGRRVVHLATHGFFLKKDCAQDSEGQRGIGGLAPATHRVDPREQGVLQLSGLALAGANLRDQVPVDGEDGILTAEELAVLDLSGVEWAVLSACNSGVGRIEDGEGVFGLRRALEIAGVRTIILSLWAVRDDVTMAWMNALYEARFTEGLDTAAAMQRACRRTLAERRARGATVHPVCWAAFQASGSWR